MLYRLGQEYANGRIYDPMLGRFLQPDPIISESYNAQNFNRYRKIKSKYLQGRPFDVPVSILSNDLARNELGWSPTIALGDGLLRTIDWIKRNRE